MSRKNKRQSKWTIGRMAKRSNNWERQNKDSFRENINKTRYMSKKSAKGLRDLVFICRSINRAVYTGKKRKALSGLNNWVVTMFFFILIKWLRRDVFFLFLWNMKFSFYFFTGLGPCLPNNLSTYGARRFHISRSEWDRVFSRLTVVPGLSWFPIDEQEGKWNYWI